MKNLKIKAKVLEVSQPIKTASKSGFFVNLTTALISDETGTINLSLLGAPKKELSINGLIQIDNAYVKWYRGENQLRIGKRGKLKKINPNNEEKDSI
jgi:replication factor A1